jgi:hypothetical protein
MSRLPILAAIASCAIAGAAFAQQPATLEALGAVKEVRGVVTMSLGSQVATVQPETPVFDGARFVAGSSGSAQLKFENGCVLDLKPNEWVTIDGKLDCPRQIAAIQSVSNLAGGALLGSAHTLPLLGIAAVTGVVAKEIDITTRPR